MAYWFLELLLGLMFLRQLRQALEFCLTFLAPRRWREANLPTPPNAENHGIVGMVGIFASTSLLVFLVNRLPVGQAYIASLVLLAAAIYMVTWALVYVKHWWILEPGAPLRKTLDAIASSTGISVGRVRLRESKALTPRVYSDGSIELSTEFIREVPADEQAFLIAAALHQGKTKQPLRRLISWGLGMVVFPVAVYTITVLSDPQGANALPIKYWYVLGCMFFAFCIVHGPKYDWETLKFALKATGNLEVIERVVRRTDSYEVEKRMTDLRKWWEKRQLNPPATLPTISANTTPSVPQQQTLGRKP